MATTMSLGRAVPTEPSSRFGYLLSTGPGTASGPMCRLGEDMQGEGLERPEVSGAHRALPSPNRRHGPRHSCDGLDLEV